MYIILFLVCRCGVSMPYPLMGWAFSLFARRPQRVTSAPSSARHNVYGGRHGRDDIDSTGTTTTGDNLKGTHRYKFSR